MEIKIDNDTSVPYWKREYDEDGMLVPRKKMKKKKNKKKKTQRNPIKVEDDFDIEIDFVESDSEDSEGEDEEFSKAHQILIDISDSFDSLDKIKDKEETTVIEKKMVDLQKKYDEMVDSNMCVICMENKKNIALGCGHLCLCVKCCDLVTLCPLCRKTITTKMKIFF